MERKGKTSKKKKRKGIKSFISLRADPERSDEIGRSLSQFSFVEDVLLLTGDFDFMIKANFDSYDQMKRFLTIELGDIEGVEDPTSRMVVSAYKENNEFLKAKEPEKENMKN